MIFLGFGSVVSVDMLNMHRIGCRVYICEFESIYCITSVEGSIIRIAARVAWCDQGGKMQ